MFTESDLKPSQVVSKDDINDEDGMFLGLFDNVDDGKQICVNSTTSDELESDNEINDNFNEFF